MRSGTKLSQFLRTLPTNSSVNLLITRTGLKISDKFKISLFCTICPRVNCPSVLKSPHLSQGTVHLFSIATF